MVRWRLSAVYLLALQLLLEPPAVTAFYSAKRKHELRELTRATWQHAYGSYKRLAFPLDEVLPISCRGQGHDRINRENTSVNDVMGDFALTLVDSLDAFAVLGDRAGFESGVREAIQHVKFDLDSRVQVFEVTIRMLGGLLSAHLLAINPTKGFKLNWYKNELLQLAYDLAQRLLPAFQTPTGIPYARIHLQHGIKKGETTETCAAGAASLLLEFGTLTRLTGEPIFEQVAKKAFYAIWNRRSDLNLVGNTIAAHDGRWMHTTASTGAGIDSLYEYAVKAYILFGEDEYLRVWEDMYAALQRHSRSQDGFWYRGVNMITGQLASVYVDSLSAFFPGVQTLIGDLESAVKSHAVFAYQWKRYRGLPELFDIHRREAVQFGYPLRPEFIESNLYLHQATKDDWYLEIAEMALHDIVNRTRTDCGLAAVLDLRTGELEDKMPSFVTAETLKYLYLTFDEDNPFNTADGAMVYSTEGHPLELPAAELNVAKNRTRRTASVAAPICSAWNPMASDFYQHPILLSVQHRTDFEHARFLAGYDPISDDSWLQTSWCELGLNGNFDIEILFAAHNKEEIISPTKQQIYLNENGSGFVAIISGLRFTLNRIQTHSESYRITKIANLKIPSGEKVFITDPKVLLALPKPRIDKISLALSFNPDTSSPPVPVTAQITGLVGSFGPSLAHPPQPNSFAFHHPHLKIIQSKFPYGCEPHHPSEKYDIEGKVLLVQRGKCTFAHKANLAALGGAKGVICVNEIGENDEIVPSADEEELKLKEMVPLILISNSTLTSLFENWRQLGFDAEKSSIWVQPQILQTEKEPKFEGPVLLGGYNVVNCHLVRP